jgi:membrane-associated protein
MLPTVLHPVMSLIPWLDPKHLIEGFGVWAIVVVCAFVFAETGLLVGFVLPGDTLLIISGVLAFPGARQVIHIDIWWVCLAISAAAFAGGEVGYLIGRKAGPRVFERKESGFFSRKNVERTNAFFTRFGGFAVIAARFVPIVRTFAPVAAGVGHMRYRRYSLYNAIGALLWGSGLTFAGYLLNYIPPLRDFITSYVDLILLGAACIAIIPTAYHAIRSTMAARKARAAGMTDAMSEEEVLLDPSVFDGRPKK